MVAEQHSGIQEDYESLKRCTSLDMTSLKTETTVQEGKERHRTAWQLYGSIT